MAKRGYRGAHPYDDTKVSKHSASTDKRNPKLDVEYNKLNVKQKYSYIRDHQGFFPVGTASVGPFTTDVLNNQTVTLISTDGTSVQYIAKDSGESLADNHFASDGNAAAHATSFAACVNHASGHGGKILAVATDDTVALTQLEPGPDGNTTIVETLASEVDAISAAFTGG
jgi:hypothetical protein